MSRTTDIGVILAAGRGSRMSLFSDRLPKPVLPVCNRPLIAYQIDILKSLGVKRLILVIGHLGGEIVRAIDQIKPVGLSVEFVDQGELLGIAHAVGQLESHVDAPFFLFLGDIFFLSSNLSSMRDIFLREEEVKAVLSVKSGETPAAIQRNFAVFLDDDGYVKRVVEKPHHVRTDRKGCGLYLFDLEIFDAIRRTQRTALRDEYEITDSIQILIDDGYRVRASDNIRFDINLTFPEDILRANLTQLDHTGMSRCVAPGAETNGAALLRTVVGEGAFIASGSRLENCLILPNTRIEAPVDWRGVIASGSTIIPCRWNPDDPA